jgi:large subunit ribosomal protein L7Ae
MKRGENMEDDKILQIIEIARNTGKIKIGTNEATKAIERSAAKLIVYAEDVSPKEIVMHIAPLCNEKKIPCVTVKSKQDLGRAAGIDVSTAAVAILEAGEAKKDIEELAKHNK